MKGYKPLKIDWLCFVSNWLSVNSWQQVEESRLAGKARLPSTLSAHSVHGYTKLLDGSCSWGSKDLQGPASGSKQSK